MEHSENKPAEWSNDKGTGDPGRDIKARAGNTAFKFLSTNGAAITGFKGELRWYRLNPAGTASDKTIIEGDIRDRKAGFSIELTGLKTLVARDFIL